MPREYYVYPNGTPIAVAGNNEYATQIPMSASDATDVYTAINGKAPSKNMLINSDFICNTFDDTELNASGWIFSASSTTKPQLIGAMGLQILPPCTDVEIATPIWYPAWSATQGVPSIDFPITVSVEYAYNTLSPETLRVASVTYPDNTQTSTARNIAELESGVYLQIKLTNTGTDMVSRSVFTISAQLTKPLYIRRIKIERNSSATPFAQAMNDLALLSVVKSSYVKKSGDTMTGSLTLSGTQVQRTGGNTSWIRGRDVAPVKTTSGGGSWNPVVSAKSVNGAWGIGTLNDVLYFSYGTDANYNAGTNTANNYSLDTAGNLSNNINAQKFGGYTADLSTNNTSDTWVPVMSGSKMQHRVVPTDYNTAPTTDATANRIVKRDGNGYVKATYYNASNGAENIASYTSYVMFKDSNGWQRMTSLANFKSWFGTANSATKANIVANYVSGGTGSNLRFHAQTSVLTASGTGVQLVTAAALNTIFGVSNCGAGNTAVFVSNGDGNAWGGHFDGCNYIGSGTPAWWATMNTSVSGTVRINWLAVYFG